MLRPYISTRPPSTALYRLLPLPPSTALYRLLPLPPSTALYRLLPPSTNRGTPPARPGVLSRPICPCGYRSRRILVLVAPAPQPSALRRSRQPQTHRGRSCTIR